jgi:hypothetical protein
MIDWIAGRMRVSRLSCCTLSLNTGVMDGFTSNVCIVCVECITLCHLR